MSSTESVTFAAQIAALFVVALSASGFLVLAHYLAPLGIPATILTKTQLLAAGFSYIITIVLSPAVSYGLAVWFAAGKRQNTVRILLFIVFNIFIESFILDQIFISISGKITTGVTRFPLILIATVTFFYACTTTQGRILARKLLREHTSEPNRLAQANAHKIRKPTTKTLTIKRIPACALVASSATYFFLLWKISHEAVIILLFLCVSGDFACCTC